ncbi:hypothetical protein V495_07103 [Pseudogymnoascus sp. VKM F-4514 (FW-929)]|nr:hypothetical protein V495_07103 [Pseudogymnoascus sp. VKM F-4514 (FW-929)]KFY56850.1 hypothetical protein V497_05926 [Pseudogymnoascus sp. VKM F-4516 (FW-969)]
MPSTFLSGRDLANRAIRAQRNTIRDQGNQIAKMQYLMDLMCEDIDELIEELHMQDNCEVSDPTVYTDKDYLWECPDYEEDPRAWQRWKDMHPWLEDLDEDERAWRCAEGTIKALNRKLTMAAEVILDLRIQAARVDFRKMDSERQVTVLKKKLERLRRRFEQQSGDEHGDGLIGLAALESWPCYNV